MRYLRSEQPQYLYHVWIFLVDVEQGRQSVIHAPPDQPTINAGLDSLFYPCKSSDLHAPVVQVCIDAIMD
jgi:hypothetical protein